MTNYDDVTEAPLLPHAPQKRRPVVRSPSASHYLADAWSDSDDVRIETGLPQPSKNSKMLPKLDGSCEMGKLTHKSRFRK